MNEPLLENLNVLAAEVLKPPERLKGELPVGEAAAASVRAARETLRRIVDGHERRMFIVVGPCSIHDPRAALEYAHRLRALADELADTLCLVMRVYFEKPRTTVGWKGLINDPYLDDTFRVEEGLRIARRLMLDIADLGLPMATEALDPIAPQYLHDLVAWSAVGARTTESQTHREMASGLSSVVGFKNGTDGSLDVAINALQSVSRPHRFLGINQAGQVAVIHTRGNAHAHIVLRGGGGRTNYDAESVAAAERALSSIGARRALMIDCSHANASRQHRRQVDVALDVVRQIEAGNRSIVALMLESNLEEGNQPMGRDGALRYGVSVTDPCIDWSATANVLRELRTRVAKSLR